MSLSTRENPSRTIVWLFHSPANAKSKLWWMTIPGHSLDTSVGKLEWVASLKDMFEFQVIRASIEFWVVSTARCSASCFPSNYPFTNNWNR